MLHGFFLIMKKLVEDHILVANTHLSGDNYILEFKSPVPVPEIKPGNFAEIRVPDTAEVFLRRPFSVLDVDIAKNSISFYVKVIGKGTEQLSRLAPGTKVNLIYPLGNSFSLPTHSEKVLIVGGGSGIAPFILFIISILII